MVKTISMGVQTLAASLVKGGDAFKDFGSKLLQMLGALAIQVGEVLLTTGIGMLALKFLDPTGAIIAGLGLIALGGIMQAIGGAGGGATAGAGGGGGAAGGVTGLAESPDITELEDTEKQKTGPTVIFDIKGPILDRRQTGLELAEIMNEVIGSNGVVFQT